MKVLKWLDEHLEETLLVILLVVITAVSFLQVVIRKIPWIPALTWAEEFCRFCWIWSVFLSLPFTIRKGSMLRVTALLDIMPNTMRQILNVIVDAVTTASMALLAFHSVTVVNDIRISNEASPAMLWPMWLVYSIMLIGFTLGTLRGVQQFVLHIMHFGDKGKTTVEQAMEDAKEETKLAKGGNN